MNKNINILIPLPSYGFDPSEAAIPWKILSQNSIKITFATPNGKPAQGDVIMLTGKGLGIFKPILKAGKDAVEAYGLMHQSKEFLHPINYDEINSADFDGIFLPGGHDKGVKEYLESKILQNVIPDFFRDNKKIGAVCHGPLLLARSKNKQTNKSVIYDYKTTGLLKTQELLAYYLTKLWLNDYYLTYPGLTVEDEIKSVLISPDNFLHGNIPLFRDTETNSKPAFVVKDRNYVSARWPGDIYTLGNEFLKLIKQSDN